MMRSKISKEILQSDIIGMDEESVGDDLNIFKRCDGVSGAKPCSCYSSQDNRDHADYI